VRESAVAESISRACVCGRSMRDRKAKDNKKETDGGGDGAAVRQFGRVLCGRHVGHIAGERGFSMTTRSIGSMAPPRCGPYARVNTHRRRDVTDDGISVGTDPTTNRASWRNNRRRRCRYRCRCLPRWNLRRQWIKKCLTYIDALSATVVYISITYLSYHGCSSVCIGTL